MAQFLDTTGLRTLWNKIKSSFLSLSGGSVNGPILIEKTSYITFLNESDEFFLSISGEGIQKQRGSSTNECWNTAGGTTSFKTINNQTITGNGNITIESDDNSLQLFAYRSSSDYNEITDSDMQCYSGNALLKTESQNIRDGVEFQLYSSDTLASGSGFSACGSPTHKYINLNIGIATTSGAGLMSAKDKRAIEDTKIDTSKNYASYWTDCSNKPSGLTLRKVRSIDAGLVSGFVSIDNAALYYLCWMENGQSSTVWRLTTDMGLGDKEWTLLVLPGLLNTRNNVITYSGFIVLPDWDHDSNAVCAASTKFESY